MSRLTNGGPAFPATTHNDGDGNAYPGMTLRDYFAAKAMQADLSNWPEDAGDWLKHRGDLAHRYYQMADAMLAEREKEPSGSIRVAQSKVAETLDYVSADPDEGRHAVGFAYLVGLIDRAEWERRLEALSPADDDDEGGAA